VTPFCDRTPAIVTVAMSKPATEVFGFCQMVAKFMVWLLIFGIQLTRIKGDPAVLFSTHRAIKLRDEWGTRWVVAG
jgi:hypothetical protein